MINNRLKFSIIFFVILISIFPISVKASDIEEIELDKAIKKVHEAFELVVEASESGGDVENLLTKLNESLSFITKGKKAELSQFKKLLNMAYELAEWVEDEALKVKEEGLRQRQSERNIWILSISGVVLGGLLVYFLGPKIYWSFWLRMRRNYFVRLNQEEKPVEDGSLITSGEVWSVIFALIVLVSIFAYSEFYFSRNVVEPFSEFGILGPNLKIGDYPRNVTVGENVNLNIFISNNMGKPTYYVVMAKLRDKESSLDPAPGSPDVIIDLILSHEDERIIPFNFTIINPGLNQRLVFELWTYNVTSKSVEYHDRWGWIWINAIET